MYDQTIHLSVPSSICLSADPSISAIYLPVSQSVSQCRLVGQWVGRSVIQSIVLYVLSLYPCLKISQSEAMYTVLISQDIKSPTWCGPEFISDFSMLQCYIELISSCHGYQLYLIAKIGIMAWRNLDHVL